MIEACERPSKARRLVSISYTIAPNAKMSLRTSTSWPSTCSGAMYCSVPAIVPSSVSGCRVSVSVNAASTAAIGRSFARPKSRSLAPDLVRMTLPGFRSRWTTPAACAAASASPISRAYLMARSTGNRPCARRWASVSPSRYSMTRKSAPSWCPTSNSGQMWG